MLLSSVRFWNSPRTRAHNVPIPVPDCPQPRSPAFQSPCWVQSFCVAVTEWRTLNLILYCSHYGPYKTRQVPSAAVTGAALTTLHHLCQQCSSCWGSTWGLPVAAALCTNSKGCSQGRQKQTECKATTAPLMKSLLTTIRTHKWSQIF